MKPSSKRRLQMLLKRKTGTTSIEIIEICRTVCPHRRLADLEQEGWRIVRKDVEGVRWKRYYGTPPKGWKMSKTDA